MGTYSIWWRNVYAPTVASTTIPAARLTEPSAGAIVPAAVASASASVTAPPAFIDGTIQTLTAERVTLALNAQIYRDQTGTVADMKADSMVTIVVSTGAAGAIRVHCAARGEMQRAAAIDDDRGGCSIECFDPARSGSG